MSILNMKIVKTLISKAITKLIQKKLFCESAVMQFDEVNLERTDGNVSIRINVNVTMKEEDLVELINRKIEEL